MVASGNIGKNLETESNTYVSWNGGKNWQEARRGYFVPEIGDYGSTIVMVREDSVVDEVVYSISDGDEWKTCKFTDTAFTVSNIRVDPEWDSRRFILYGTRDVNGEKSAVIVQLNFEEEYSGQCGGDDVAVWSPTDENGHCVLGLSHKYRKRKAGRTCYFGEGWTSDLGGQSCNCSIADYECAPCFYRPDLHSICTKECEIDPEPTPTSECENSGYFSTALAYQKIDNSMCVNNDPTASPPKGLYPCYQLPSSPTSITSSLIPILLVVIVFLGGLIFLGYVLIKKNKEVKDFITNTLGFNLGQTPVDSIYSTVEQGDSSNQTTE